MGSSNLNTKPSSTKQKAPCLYTNLSKFDVTCEKTNKIDIDKYFQLMKDEVIKMENPANLQSNEKYFKRSMSSGKIERKKKSSSQRPKDSRKRSSCDVSNILGNEKDKSKERSYGYFSYDLSGQVVQVGEHKDDRCLSKQKSWDLSISKVKGPSRFYEDYDDDDDDDDDFVRSYSAGDFKDSLNNNTRHHSRSMESFDDLNARHRESAMTHGKIYSVSEQNRRLRKKYFRKEKANSIEKVNVLSASVESIEKIFDRSLVLDEASSPLV